MAKRVMAVEGEAECHRRCIIDLHRGVVRCEYLLLGCVLVFSGCLALDFLFLFWGQVVGYVGGRLHGAAMMENLDRGGMGRETEAGILDAGRV
ncbi:hypothetical protein IQ07DRAFT_369180 [Pyrenochaeta sp. DS3sAY3a]|nr:hypothetical protein IQ07DRAFT_369180 [Pyrenochaeta sp. DS3sAY3a]